MAVGQVDVLVGLPTLNNAATVLDVVRAIHLSFTRDFPRLRTVMITSDGGSTDGTPDLIRTARFAEADMVQTSHTLRTLHRVVTPYHGLPGKHTVLRTLFAAGELTQTRALIVVDPAGPATTPERVTELIAPMISGEVDFLTPRYRRDPRDGVLITQLVRPLVRALYGVGLDEPLGAEFSCSRRFAVHCLDQPIWEHDAARFAIDLRLRTEAVAGGFTIGQIWRPTPGAAGTRARLREAVQQIVLAAIESLRAHDRFWLHQHEVVSLPTRGTDPGVAIPAQVWDYEALAAEASHDIGEIKPLLQEVIAPELLARVVDGAVLPLADELWVRVVYAFAAAASRGVTSVDHLATMFVPLYLWRAATFMADAAFEDDSTVQARLGLLCETFHRLKPVLVTSWSAE
jgi:hypothetical protein